MTPPPLDLSQPQRQSPLAVLFLGLRILRQVGLAQIAIALVLISRADLAILLVVVPLAGLVVLGFGTLSWWRFTFRIEENELRVTRGVFSEDKLTVPLDRVQSVSLDQQFLHRIVGLVQVSLDTAGTSEAEFTIHAVDRTVADALARVAAERRVERVAAPEDGTPPPPPVVEREILRRDPGRLVQAGLARPTFAGLAVIFPLLAVADDLMGALPFDVPEVDGPDLSLWMLWLAPIVAVVAVAAGVTLNLIQILLSEWGLVLTERERGFRRNAGLISRTSRTTNIDRVQWLSTAENPVERRLGIRRVNLPTIGEGDLALPGTDDEELAVIRGLVIDPDARVSVLDRQVSPAEVFLATRNTAVAATIAAVGLWFAIGWWALLALLLVPWEYLETRRKVRLFRWGVDGAGIARHQELVTGQRREMMLRKVNGVTIRRRLFERSRDLATVQLHTASGSLRIGMIPLDEARALRDLVLARVETDSRAWM